MAFLFYLCRINNKVREMATLKICTCCNKEYPKNKDFFFKKILKQKNKKGENKIYHSFRSVCKKCHAKQTKNRLVKKRCIELNCDISDYNEQWRAQYSNTRTRDMDAKNILTKSQYQHYLKGNYKDASDYLECIEKTKNDRNNRIIKSVKDRQKYFTDEQKRQALRQYAKNNSKKLSDCYIANMLMLKPISELTKEIIETKRLIVQLKREIKNK